MEPQQTISRIKKELNDEKLRITTPEQPTLTII